MTPVSCVVLSSELDITSEKPILSFYLLRRLAATVLRQHCFQGQIFRCLWLHVAQRITQVPRADSFCPLVWWNGWSLTQSWKDTLCLSPFSSTLYVSLYNTFCTHATFQCGHFTISFAEVSQSEKHLCPCTRQVSCSYRVLSYRDNCQAVLITFLGFCIHNFSSLQVKSSCLGLFKPLFYPRTRAGSLCLLALGRFPFWCCDLPSQALYDGSCALESTAQKRKTQTWNKSKLLIKPHSGQGKQMVISLIEGWGNWGSLPRSCGRRC